MTKRESSAVSGPEWPAIHSTLHSRTSQDHGTLIANLSQTYHQAMTGIRLADRMARLGTESAFEVLARARAIEDAGGKIIHLEIGEPDFPTASHIVEAAVEALRAGATHYVPAPGIPPLRQAVAAFLERTGRMRVTPDRVIVTPGAKPIMFFTILALAGEGDEVLYPDPGFPMYSSIAALEGPWDPVDQMVAEFRRRRDIIVAGLNDIPGISCLEPQGAFYAFPNITETGLTSSDVQAGLLDDAGVAALSGAAFGACGEGFLRFSYANSIENIRLALEAIRAQLS